LFNQCRFLFQKLWSGNKLSFGDKHESIRNIDNINSNLTKKTTFVDDGVGESEIKASFGIGHAPRDAKPVNKCKTN
jgi:hypothetical protein